MCVRVSEGERDRERDREKDGGSLREGRWDGERKGDHDSPVSAPGGGRVATSSG